MRHTNSKLTKLLIAFWLTSQTIHSLADSPQSFNQKHQQAIAQAKAGQYENALLILNVLVAENSKDMRLLADLMVVNSWANKPQAALDLAAKVELSRLPNDALSVLAKAARDTRNYSQAVSLYSDLLKREPNNIDAALGYTLSLTDAKEYVKAETESTKLRQLHPKLAGVYQVLSYLGVQSQQPVLVLDASKRLLEINNNDNQAAQLLIRATSDLGATPQALQYTKEYPQALRAEDMASIKNDEIANLIQWGELAQLPFASSSPQVRFAETDAALKKLDEACQCDWAKPNLADARTKNLVFDRMVALRDRYRMQEVVQHYQQLTQSKTDMPDYVLNAAGDAHLYLRDSVTALQAYNASLAKTPDNNETVFSKFYALVELERYDEATKLINDQAALLKPYRNRPKNPVVRQYDAKYSADSKVNFAKAYGDDLARAEHLFDTLANIGPINENVKLSLGEIWRWRGWHQKAQQQFLASTKAQPQSVQAKADLAHSRIDMRQWNQAEQETQALFSQYPENSAVQQLNQRWQLRNMRELVLEAASSESSGSVIGSRFRDARAALYSSPFNYNYRAFVQTGYHQSTFPEGDATVYYPGVGLEYTDPVWRLTGAVSQPSIGGVGTELSFTADYRVDDYLMIASALDINSSQMPLRGLRTGISADLAQVQAIYRWSELTRVSAGVGVMRMDDGNNRKSLNLILDKRLITTPRYKLTVHARTDTSGNTQNNAIYFNPDRDLEYGAILDNEWLLWRHYERSFTHRLQLGTGNYWQKNFGNGKTWFASYEHQWKLDDRFALVYGVSRNSHPYDGLDEYFTQYFGRLNYLF
jgi:biofilm PGA synthesis protein PgaA